MIVKSIMPMAYTKLNVKILLDYGKYEIYFLLKAILDRKIENIEEYRNDPIISIIKKELVYGLQIYQPISQKDCRFSNY